MLQSRGLRISIAGFAVFFLGVVSLLFLPEAIAALVMVAGGMAVWIGFAMTLFAAYSGSSSSPPDGPMP